MISLIQLEYLVALAHYQSFSLAAENCYVTQPTLSMQIKKMETDLNVVLFDRTKKPVKPTSLGEQLIAQAKIILSETAKIHELVQQNLETLSGTLRIGIIPSIAPYLLPNFIGKFAQDNPRIEIKIKELLSADIMEAIDHDQIDIGILATPLPRDEYAIYPLFYEKILLYCHPTNDLAAYDSIDIKQMRDKKIWLMSDGNCFRNQAINICDLKENSAESNFHYESASIETLIKLVNLEGGITLIPELAAGGLARINQGNVKPFKHISPIREVSLITNRLFVKKRMIEALAAAIQNNVAKEMCDKSRGEVVEWN